MSSLAYIAIVDLFLAYTYVYMEGMLCHEEGKFSTILGYFGSAFVCSALLWFFPNPYLFLLLCGYLFAFFYLLYHKEHDLRKAILIYSFLLLILAIFHSSILYMVSELMSVTCSPLSFASMLFYFSGILILLPYLIKIQQKRYDVPFFSPLSFLAFLCFLILCGNLQQSDVWLILYGCVLLVICILLKQSMRIDLREERILQEHLAQFQSKENKERYQWLLQENEHMARTIHDMKKHLMMLDSYMKDHEDEEIEIYRKEVAKQADDMLDCIRYGHPMLDRILSIYAGKWKAAGILFNVEMDDVDISFIAPVDFSAVLMNMLDNAYESCNVAKEKFILLKIKEVSTQSVMIKMKNSCDYIKDQEGKLITTKEDHLYHGFGLKNMEQLAKKYHGVMHTSYDEKRHIFTTTVSFSKEA